jgi:transposase-like protein
LLLAVGIDANGNGLVLALAVESENEDSWRKHLAILEIKEEVI